MTPLVSVVIPTHDGAATIGAALESALGQRDVALEVIVVDDASSDGTIDVVTEIARTDQRVRMLRRPTSSGGPARPRNEGVAAAAGSFVALLDQDDRWLPDKLRRQLDLAAASGADVVYSRCLVDDATNVGTAPGDYHERWTTLGRSPLPEGAILGRLCIEDVVPVPTALFSRAIIERVGGFDEMLIGVDDYDLVLRCALGGGLFAAVQDVTAIYSWTDENLSHMIATRRADTLSDMWDGLVRDHPGVRELVGARRDHRTWMADSLLHGASGIGITWGARLSGAWRGIRLGPTRQGVGRAGYRCLHLVRERLRTVYESVAPSDRR